MKCIRKYAICFLLIFFLCLIITIGPSNLVAATSVTLSATSVVRGDTVRVTWSRFSGLVNVIVENLYDGSTPYTYANTQGASSGYQDLVTTTWPIRSDYRVKIEQKANTAIYQRSDYFSVNLPPPTLQSPADYNVFKSGTAITFQWSAVTGAVQYKLEADNNWGTSDADICTSTPPTVSCTLNSLTHGDNVYSWRVSAKDANGNWSGFNYRQFVSDTPPGAPGVGGPANGAAYTQGASIPFSWSAPSGVSNVARYFLRIVQGTDLNATPYKEYELTPTSKSENTTGWPPGTYTWAVRAIKTAPTGYDQTTYENTIRWGAYTATRTVVINPVPFDLAVSVDSIPTNVQKGGVIPVICTVKRTGGILPRDGFVRVYLYMNQSSTSLDGAKEICGVSCAFDFSNEALDDGTETLSKNITVPTDIEGPFYIHAVVDGPTYWSETNEDNNSTASATTIAVWQINTPPDNEPTGILARTWSDSTVYWIKYGKKWPIKDGITLTNLGYTDADVKWYSFGAFDAIATGKTILQDNDNFAYRKQSPSTVYIIRNGKSDWFFNWDTFVNSEFGTADVYWATDAGFNWIQGVYPPGQLIGLQPRIRVMPDKLVFE